MSDSKQTYSHDRAFQYLGKVLRLQDAGIECEKACCASLYPNHLDRRSGPGRDTGAFFQEWLHIAHGGLGKVHVSQAAISEETRSAQRGYCAPDWNRSCYR